MSVCTFQPNGTDNAIGPLVIAPLANVYCIQTPFTYTGVTGTQRSNFRRLCLKFQFKSRYGLTDIGDTSSYRAIVKEITTSRIIS